MGKSIPNLTDRIQYPLAVSVSRINHQDIRLFRKKSFRPFQYIRRHADSRSRQQPPIFILGGIGILPHFLYILNRNKALQIPVLIN